MLMTPAMMVLGTQEAMAIQVVVAVEAAVVRATTMMTSC